MKETLKPLSLFEGYGIELEYMIVDRESLKVLPVSDRLMEIASGEISGEIIYNELGWSNELVLHVLEMKTPGPAPQLKALPSLFHKGILNANKILKGLGGMLMPTAMHPFFNPDYETKLWPHDNKEIYETYDRIFNCRGHGWSNLQSIHINLPFCGDLEFAKLHAAIRLILPLLPAIASSSPIVEGNLTGFADNRLEFYRKNQARLPIIAGKIIPEQAFSKNEYEKQIYEPIHTAVAPFDVEKILDPVWLNSRGAIARFDRNAIEIRLLDIQECPKADVAVISFVVGLIRSLINGFWGDLKTQKDFQSEPLLLILLSAIAKGENAILEDQNYLRFFKYPESGKVKFQDFLCYLYETLIRYDSELLLWKEELDLILKQGTLSTRIVKALPQNPKTPDITEIYRSLCLCLSENRLFHA